MQRETQSHTPLYMRVCITILAKQVPGCLFSPHTLSNVLCAGKTGPSQQLSPTIGAQYFNISERTIYCLHDSFDFERGPVMYRIVITASDGQLTDNFLLDVIITGATVTAMIHELSFTQRCADVNDPPQLLSSSTVSVAEHTEVGAGIAAFSLTVQDDDNDKLSITAACDTHESSGKE